MAEKQRLQDGFEPVWQEDFDLIREIGPRAFCLRLYMQICRDHETGICKLSDLSIQRIFGWDRKTSRKLKRLLISQGYIVEKGHITYIVRYFRRLSTDWGKYPQSTGENIPTPKHDQLGKNSPLTGEKFPSQLGKNSPLTGEKFPTPIITESELQNKNRAENVLKVDEILKTVGQKL